jgi:hypothetical protein
MPAGSRWPCSALATAVRWTASNAPGSETRRAPSWPPVRRAVTASRAAGDGRNAGAYGRAGRAAGGYLIGARGARKSVEGCTPSGRPKPSLAYHPPAVTRLRRRRRPPVTQHSRSQVPGSCITGLPPRCPHRKLPASCGISPLSYGAVAAEVLDMQLCANSVPVAQGCT